MGREENLGQPCGQRCEVVAVVATGFPWAQSRRRRARVGQGFLVQHSHQAMAGLTNGLKWQESMTTR